MWKLRAALCVAALAVAGSLLGCGSTPDPWPEKSGPRVLTSFAPLHCFALNVAGEDATVLPIMTTHGPHGFNDSPRDHVKLRRADLFFINGLDLDNAVAKRMVAAGGNRDLRLVAVGEIIPVSQLREGACNCGHEHGDEHHDHAHGVYDPHVWLGIPEAILMVHKIRDELKKADPAHAEGYDRRAADYVDRLKNLQMEGRALLKNKKERKIVTFHDSLFYFARTFDLTIVDSIEIAAGTEASNKRKSELVKKCVAEGVRLIAIEPQYPSNTSAKAILEELKLQGVVAEFVLLDPLETAPDRDLASPEFYESRMRRNLEELARKLQ